MFLRSVLVIASGLVNAAIQLDIQQSIISTTQFSGHSRIMDRLTEIGVEFEEGSWTRDSDVGAGVALMGRDGKEIVVGLDNHMNTIHFVDVTFGTPTQQFKLMLDTGSNQLWVGSKHCQDTFQCNNLNTFNPAASSTFKDTSAGVFTNITYGKGFVEGLVGTDVIGFAGTSVPDMPFMVVASEDEDFRKQINGTSDGIMGLAYVGGLDGIQNVTGVDDGTLTPTVVKNLIAGGRVESPVFSIALASVAPGVSTVDGKSGGSFVLGGIVNASYYTGNFTYVPATSDVAKGYYWTVPISAFQTVSSSAKAITVPPKLHAVVDSGSSMMAIDYNTYTKQVLPILSASASLLFSQNITLLESCSDISKLPSLTFSMQPGAVFTLTPQQYVLQLKVEGTTACAVGILPISMKTKSGETLWILGETFMRSYVTVFDYGNGGRVGFATAAASAAGGGGAAKSGVVGMGGVGVWVGLVLGLLTVL
ncbi:hypothetical protein HDU98_012312 [Podochytrium sp. JEL0797]|nr:hypothetical protein HDU98_012312 [Podochytrium sp. JEL0797]